MFHRSTFIVQQKIYLNDYVRKRLLPFIKYHHKGDNIVVLARSCVITLFKTFLTAHQINFVQHRQNPPNIPQARPIETIWSLLEQKVYEGGWEAKNLNQLARRIILKAKQLDQNMVTRMTLGVRRKLLKIYTDSVC